MYNIYLICIEKQETPFRIPKKIHYTHKTSNETVNKRLSVETHTILRKFTAGPFS